MRNSMRNKLQQKSVMEHRASEEKAKNDDFVCFLRGRGAKAFIQSQAIE